MAIISIRDTSLRKGFMFAPAGLIIAAVLAMGGPGSSAAQPMWMKLSALYANAASLP